jgi:hypothetical protein
MKNELTAEEYNFLPTEDKLLYFKICKNTRLNTKTGVFESDVFYRLKPVEATTERHQCPSDGEAPVKETIEEKPVPNWYDEMSIDSWLTNKLFHMGVSREAIKLVSKTISADYANELQRAFAKGWEKAYNDYKKSGTFNYEYYPKPDNIGQKDQDKANLKQQVIEILESEAKSSPELSGCCNYLISQVKELKL